MINVARPVIINVLIKERIIQYKQTKKLRNLVAEQFNDQLNSFGVPVSLCNRRTVTLLLNWN